MALAPSTNGLDTFIDPESSLDKEVNGMESSSGPGTDIEKEPTQQEQTSNSEKEAVTRVPTAQDWTGPDDPENPQNWSFIRKVYHTAVVGLLAFA